MLETNRKAGVERIQCKNIKKIKNFKENKTDRQVKNQKQ